MGAKGEGERSKKKGTEKGVLEDKMRTWALFLPVPFTLLV